MKFRCIKDIAKAEGTQEFEVEAKDLESATEKFKAGEGELVATECEVIALDEYDLECIWEEN